MYTFLPSQSVRCGVPMPTITNLERTQQTDIDGGRDPTERKKISDLVPSNDVIPRGRCAAAAAAGCRRSAMGKSNSLFFAVFSTLPHSSYHIRSDRIYVYLIYVRRLAWNHAAAAENWMMGWLVQLWRQSSNATTWGNLRVLQR